MNRYLTATLAALVLALAPACADDPSPPSATPDDTVTPTTTTTLLPNDAQPSSTVDPDPPVTEALLTAAEASAIVDEAIVAAGLEPCPSTADGTSGHVVLGFAPCSTDPDYPFDDVRVWVYAYADLAGQADDLPTREMDSGLRGWTWGNVTVVVEDRSSGPDADALERIDAAMATLGATLAFDSVGFS